MVKWVSAAGFVCTAGLTRPFYSAEHIVYLEIFFLQIIFFHENNKKCSLSWKSYFMEFTNSLLILSTSLRCDFFLNGLLKLSENEAIKNLGLSHLK